MSRKIDFKKMHGAGNDFIMIDGREEYVHLKGSEIARLCDRRRGIGADGIIIIDNSEKADFRMDYYNSDGGAAELCGNGARCAARFASETGVAGIRMSFETGSGIIGASVEGEEVEVEIGKVVDIQLDKRMKCCDSGVHYAVAGVPHALVLVDESGSVNDRTFFSQARAVRYHSAFAPGGTNFNMASVKDRGHLEYRTYERGVEDETQSCGTGAVAISVICAHLGLTGTEVACTTSGGDILLVKFTRTEYGAADCVLKGPAMITFEGLFELDHFTG